MAEEKSMREWNYLQAAYHSVKVAKQLAAESLIRYINDESHPVSNRWDVFLEAPVGTLDCETNLPSELSFWKDIRPAIMNNASRYQVMLWVDLDDGGWFNFTDEQKIEIMKRGFEGFEVDW